MKLKFLDKFPTTNRSMNIALSLLAVIFLMCIVVVIILVIMKPSSKQTRAGQTNKAQAAPISRSVEPKSVTYPVADILENQLQNKQKDLEKSNAENELLKKNIKTFADTIDKNFSTVQKQISGLENRIADVESNINKQVTEKNNLKIIHLDKTPYVNPPTKKTPQPKNGKVLAQVGNVVWIDSNQKQ